MPFNRKIPLSFVLTGLIALQAILILLSILYAPSPWQLVLVVLMLTLVVILAIHTRRLLLFCRRMRIFFRQLLSGDYKTGIPGTQKNNRYRDELTQIEKMANSFAEQLVEYDRLRAERVSMYARALSSLLNQSTEAIIAADIEKQDFRFNPQARTLFGIERENYNFSDVLSSKTNARFRTFFERVVNKLKVKTAECCTLQVPGMVNAREFSFEIMPLRDQAESVTFALISVKNSRPRETTA